MHQWQHLLKSEREVLPGLQWGNGGAGTCPLMSCDGSAVGSGEVARKAMTGVRSRPTEAMGNLDP